MNMLMWRKLTVFFCATVMAATLVVISGGASTPTASADVSNCPPGMQAGVAGHLKKGDVNACYTCKVQQANSAEQNNGIDTTGNNPSNLTCTKEFTKSGGNDALKCPEGLYRGSDGWSGSEDTSKCYRCDTGGCEDSGQPVRDRSYDACANDNTECIDRQRQEHDRYMQSLRDAAPSGFNLPDKNSEVQGSRNAQLFCEYYKTPEETRFDTNYIYRACIIGYEVGYGRNNICTRLYLFGANASHKDAPNKHAERFRNYIRDMDKTTQDQLIAQSIAACEDGWNQYKVDYWYCGGNEGCQRVLRQDPSRIVDPGAAPTREIIDGSNSNLPTPAGIVFQTGTPTQTCGSIQTAYFSCGGGGNDVGTSSFWQILQIILNILIALVAIGAVGGLVFGAVKYSSAGDNASQVSDAKNIIKNVIIGVVLFLLMWAIIQYFIPGGIF